MVELNVRHVDGLAGAATAFVELFTKTLGEPDRDWSGTASAAAWWCPPLLRWSAATDG